MYHKNLTSALEHLGNMKRDTKKPFFKNSRCAESAERGNRNLNDLTSLYEKVESVLLRTASELATTTAIIPSRLQLTVLLAQVLTTASLTETCPICEPRSQTKVMDALGQEEFYSELLARQCRLVKHLEISDLHEANDTLLQYEMDRYIELSALFPLRVHSRLKSLGMLEAAAISSEFGIYHPDTIGNYTFQLEEEQEDCLGRTALHSWLDYNTIIADPEGLKQLHPENCNGAILESVNAQDILGRTPLHIACQRGWVEGVKALLKLEANTATKTIYGSTPLHYAAVCGSKEICRLLMDQRSDQFGAVDCEGHAAMYYATRERHAGVVDTLTQCLSASLEPYSLSGGAKRSVQAFENTYGDTGSAYAPVRERGSWSFARAYHMGHSQHNVSAKRGPQSSTPSSYFPLSEGNEARPSFLQDSETGKSMPEKFLFEEYM
jgi:hypothetical protein